MNSEEENNNNNIKKKKKLTKIEKLKLAKDKYMKLHEELLKNDKKFELSNDLNELEANYSKNNIIGYSLSLKKKLLIKIKDVKKKCQRTKIYK